VVWAADDAVIGAFKLFQEGAGVLPAYHELFKEIEISAAPYSDLEVKQRKLLADWNIKRGYTDTYWLDAMEQEADKDK
jgi:tRNA(adenine34) deaminase